MSKTGFKTTKFESLDSFFFFFLGSDGPSKTMPIALQNLPAALNGTLKDLRIFIKWYL